MVSRPRSRCSEVPGRTGFAASSARSGPARTGCRGAAPGPSERRLDLDPAPLHVVLQLLVDGRVDAGILVAFQQLLPLGGGQRGGGGRGPLLPPYRPPRRGEEGSYKP